MKNFSTYSSAISTLILCLLVLALPAEAGKREKRQPEDLTNFFLSPRYSRWLVGPISQMATEKEIQEYLSIASDADAEAFIENFWSLRGGGAVWPATNKQKIFDERVETADKLYAEGAIRGSATDRGTIFVLYGEPDEVTYEAHPKNRGSPIEVWRYATDSSEGLDGSNPDPIYLFRKEGTKTKFYKGPRRIGI